MGGWDDRIAELDSFRDLRDDYNGQGAVAPTADTVDGVIELARHLAGVGVVPPTCVVAGVNGTANLEWDLPDGSFITVEVTGRHAAEAVNVVHVPTLPTG